MFSDAQRMGVMKIAGIGEQETVIKGHSRQLRNSVGREWVMMSFEMSLEMIGREERREEEDGAIFLSDSIYRASVPKEEVEVPNQEVSTSEEQVMQ